MNLRNVLMTLSGLLLIVGQGAYAYELSPGAKGDTVEKAVEKIEGQRRRRGRRIRVGDLAYNIKRSNALVEVVDRESGGTFVVKFLDGNLKGKYGNNWSRESLASTRGCAKLCVGDRAFNTARSNARVKVIGIQHDDLYVLEFLTGNLKGKRGNNWSDKDLAVRGSCGNGGLCTGDRVINTSRSNVYAKVVGVSDDGKYVLRFQEGNLKGKIGSNWSRADLAVTHGCSGRFCVGDMALNKERQFVKVKVVGIQQSGYFVVKFLEGSLKGKKGSNWNGDDLAHY